jgi:hypothetical protein
VRTEAEDEIKKQCLAAKVAPMIEGKQFVLRQVNSRSICNGTGEFRNLIDTYNPDVVIGTKSWLSEEISNAEVFRTDYTTFRRERQTCGGGVIICVKKFITYAEIWFEEVYEMIAVEIKCRDPNITLEIVGIYRHTNDDMRLLEKLADRTG